MLKEERDVLEVLKSELEFMKGGGYSKQGSGGPRFIFEDSPTCFNFGHKDNPSPCSSCVIIDVKGPDLFRAHCAACHGEDARGNGPLASALKAKVSDLTVLAKNNKGEFPSALVRKIITGEDVLIPHGSREMPIWGPVFHQIELDQDWGNVRIENLLKYLQSIQQKSDPQAR